MLSKYMELVDLLDALPLLSSTRKLESFTEESPQLKCLMERKSRPSLEESSLVFKLLVALSLSYGQEA